jgi:hypothetical protein
MPSLEVAQALRQMLLAEPKHLISYRNTFLEPLLESC